MIGLTFSGSSFGLLLFLLAKGSTGVVSNGTEQNRLGLAINNIKLDNLAVEHEIQFSEKLPISETMKP